MKPVHFLLPLSLALLAPPALAATEEELMDQMFGLMPGTAVEYCAVAAPALRSPLEAEARKFTGKLRAEVAPFLKELMADSAGSPGISREQRQALKQQMLAELGKVDPDSYCKGLLAKLQTVDAGALAAAARSQYLQYRNASTPPQAAK
jgi:hypothetical protein